MHFTRGNHRRICAWVEAQRTDGLLWIEIVDDAGKVPAVKLPLKEKYCTATFENGTMREAKQPIWATHKMVGKEHAPGRAGRQTG